MASLTKIGGAGIVAGAQSTIPAALTADINIGDAAWAMFEAAGGKVVSSVTDSQGQTWTVDASIVLGTTVAVAIASISSSTVHLVAGTDKVTATLSGTTSRTAYTVAKLTGGGATNGLDQAVTATGTLSPSKATAALAQADEIVIGAVAWTNTVGGDTMTADASSTLLDNETASSSPNFKYLGTQWQETSSTAAVTMAPTLTTGHGSWAMGVAAYKLPAAGATILLGSAASAAAAYGPTVAPTAATLLAGAAQSPATAYGPSLTPAAAALALGIAQSAAAAYGLDLAVVTSIAIGAALNPALAYGQDLTPKPVAEALGAAAHPASAFGPSLVAQPVTLALGVAQSVPAAYGPTVIPASAALAIGVADSISAAFGVDLSFIIPASPYPEAANWILVSEQLSQTIPAPSKNTELLAMVANSMSLRPSANTLEIEEA